MESERVLSLDVSSKTGYSLLISSSDGIELESYGTLPQIHVPEGIYPENFVDWVYLCHIEITNLIDSFAPDVLVIEETSAGSKSIYSQKFLEWTHFLLAKTIKESKIKNIYLMTEQWRRETGCLMSKDESKHNKEVKKYKDKNDTSIAYNADGKRIGRITRKHVNVRRANEVFGKYLKTPLRKKDEDTADSLLLGYCYHLRRMKQNDQKSVVD
jgi:hypothetical protein